MPNVIYTATLDFTDNGVFNAGWRIKQGDFGSSSLNITLIDNGVIVFDDSIEPEIVFKRADGRSIVSTMQNAGPNAGYYSYNFVGNELAVPGPCVVDVKIFGSDSRTSTASCRFDVIEDTIGYDPTGAHTYDNPVFELVETATTAAETAIDSSFKAEGFAVGEQGGEPVGLDSPYYHNNAKYYSDLLSDTIDDVADLKTGLASELSARASADSNLQSQINQIVAPSGEAPSVAEVENARVGADGITYSALGDAIRNQVTPILKSKLAICYSDLTRDGFVNNNGVFTAYNGYKTTPMIPCRADKVVFVGSYIASVASNYFNLWAYDDNQNPISGVMNVPSSTSAQELSASLPNGTYYITFTTATNASNKFYLIRSIDDIIPEAIPKEFNFIDAFPYSNAGIINDKGTYLPYPDLSYRVTDYIPVSGSVYVEGNFSVVNVGYYNICGYDENKMFVENVVHFDTAYQNRQITLDPKTKYIRVMTTTSNTNNHVYSYPDMMTYLYNKIADFNNVKLLFDDKYVNNTFVTCDSTSGMSDIANNYGVAITNRINKGSIIKNITFTNANISANNAHYIIFVTCGGYVLKKWPVTACRMVLNYFVEESGYLCYCRTNGGNITPMYYKYNVASETDPNKTKINSYIFGASSGINVGDKLNPISYVNTVKNFVGCTIDGYIINSDDSYNTKYAAFLGDSITAGYTTIEGQATYVERPFPRTVQRKIGLDIQMKGYSSYPISSTGKSDCLLAVYNTISADVDYIIVFAGTNDLFYNVPIGTIADTTDISFYGAVNVLINGLATNYPNAQIVFMTPIHRSWEGANNVGAKLEDYVNAMKDVCKLCGIPVIDLYSGSYFSWAVSKFHDYYSDGLHPTQDGYDLLGNVVAKYLENVLI